MQFLRLFPFQAASLIIQHCSELFSSIDEEVYLLQEEIASSEKVSFTLELEMQEAIKMKGKKLIQSSGISVQRIKELLGKWLEGDGGVSLGYIIIPSREGW